jgi:hypothetical protein
MSSPAPSASAASVWQPSKDPVLAMESVAAFLKRAVEAEKQIRDCENRSREVIGLHPQLRSAYLHGETPLLKYVRGQRDSQQAVKNAVTLKSLGGDIAIEAEADSKKRKSEARSQRKAKKKKTAIEVKVAEALAQPVQPTGPHSVNYTSKSGLILSSTEDNKESAE